MPPTKHLSTLVATLLFTVAASTSGCAHFFSNSSSSEGGIDPVTMAGIEQSNAAQAEAQRNMQQANDTANAAAAQAAQAAQDASNAAAAAAASQ